MEEAVCWTSQASMPWEAMIQRQARGTGEAVEEFSCNSSKFRHREIRILHSLGDEVE